MRLINITRTACLVLMSGAQVCGGEPPRSIDSRLKIELFAEHPQIVTPTGLDVDHRGRVFAIESNTHFRPEGYAGHPSDRVLVLNDLAGDGRSDDPTVFADGLKFSMSVVVRPRWFLDVTKRDQPQPRQSVYVATRGEIFLFHDDDGDDRSDRRESVVRLETPGNYPHNGLAGFAIDPLGWLYFGFGENLGADYKIIGSDGRSLHGGAEGGNIYRCRLDGSLLSQVATGFWNPHASCFDAFGRLFTVDNDPDSRPPCRLLHVIPDGDYGYRFRNGRKGLHPFTAWNGEIPGTLPMVAGTGEAPSGIVAYESDGLPDEYRGNLLVTSWGDHRIDRFRLQPKGTSFTSLAEPLITGGEEFRPVGIATAPDGSLFCTDWVLRDYKLHGHGRIWRISRRESRGTRPATSNAEENSAEALKAALSDPRLPVRRLAARTIFPGLKEDVQTRLLNEVRLDPRQRLELHWASLANRPGRSPAAIDTRFLSFDSRSAASTWLQLEPAIRNSAAANSHSVSTHDEFQKQYLKHCENLLAELLAGKPSALVSQTSLLPMLHHCRVHADSPVVRLALSIDDPFIFSTIVSIAAAQFTQDDLARFLIADSTPEVKASAPTVRLAMLLAARKQSPREERLLEVALTDPDPDVRRLAVQWAAEEKLTELKPRVAGVFDGKGMTSELFLATLAALEILEGKPPEAFDKTPAGQYVVPLLKDEQRSPAVRAQALRLVSPTEKSLDAAFYRSLLKSDSEPLRLETVRTLQFANPAISGELLRDLAGNDQLDVQLRAEAVVGLAAVAKAEPVGGPTRQLLTKLLNNTNPVRIRMEALRAIRPLIADDTDLRQRLSDIVSSLTALADADLRTAFADQLRLAFSEARLTLPPSITANSNAMPEDRQEWLAQLNRGRDVDPAAGRRIFFHPNGPACFKCHVVDGRGGRVGPDLSRTIGSMNRIQLIQSILEPSREIAPQYVAWTFELKSGQTVTGMIVQENEGTTIVGDVEGKLAELKTADIEARVPQKVSVMPDKLAERMTLQELRDVIAFLDAQR